MEKRVIVAIFLCFVVLAVYQWLFPQPQTTPAVAPAEVAAGVTPEASATTPDLVADPVAAAAVAVEPVIGETVAREVVVDTDDVRAVFSTDGGTLRSWKLKHYLEDGQPLELVPSNLPPALPHPFTLATDDPALSRRLAAAIFKPSTDGLTLGPTPGQITFEYQDQSGLRARKTFYFQPEGRPYVLKVDAAVDLSGASKPVTLKLGPWIGLGYQPDKSRHVNPRVIQSLAGDIRRVAADKLATEHRFEGEFRFAGVEDQYFLSAALPGTDPVAVDYTPHQLPVPASTSGEVRTFVSYEVAVPGSVAMSFFLGPKDFEQLKNVDPRRELVRAIDFGITAPIVVPLLTALKWVNGFTHNYGWAIVTLTILINVLLFPLRHTSMVSMRKMQALQPEVKAIQERYKNLKVTDPERQKMNQEMLALYKQRGVNPASGCVPMLLTLPILFAFYALLSAAIELRGAPFAGWITDLSRHDPLYITPVLMGATMFWQQRMMPTTADPIQQKMFLLMPVIFTVSFLWAPSGLVIYWFTSNLLAIGQQYLTNRMIGTPVPARVKARR